MNPISEKGKTASTVEFVFGALCILAGITQMGGLRMLGSGGNALLGIAYLAFGAFLIVCGLEWRKLRALYSTYATILSTGSTMTVSDLAAATHATPQDTKTALKKMVRKGLANNVAIDEQSGKIIIGGPSAPTAPSTDPVTAPTSIPIETITVNCPGCGADNTVPKGATVECEHCGAPLSA